MTITIPYRWRVALYLLTGLGSPLVTYAAARGWIGADELQLWAGEVALASTVAGLNAAQQRRSRDQPRRTNREP